MSAITIQRHLILLDFRRCLSLILNTPESNISGITTREAIIKSGNDHLLKHFSSEQLKYLLP